MLNNITTETIFYFPQISNITFKGRRNGAGSHDKKYCKRRATDTQGALQITLSSYLKVTNERLESYQDKLVI